MLSLHWVHPQALKPDPPLSGETCKQQAFSQQLAGLGRDAGLFSRVSLQHRSSERSLLTFLSPCLPSGARALSWQGHCGKFPQHGGLAPLPSSSTKFSVCGGRNSLSISRALASNTNRDAGDQKDESCFSAWSCENSERSRPRRFGHRDCFNLGPAGTLVGPQVFEFLGKAISAFILSPAIRG